MSPSWIRYLLGKTMKPSRRQRRAARPAIRPTFRPCLENLEERTLLSGSPVTATLTVSPTTAPSGMATITNTLTVNSQTSFSNPLTQVGQVATTPTSTTVALDTADKL